MERKIYDCVLFLNEFDMLDMRMHILDPIVDYFVIVEATRNMKGEIRELLFEKNKERYSKFQHKIIYKVVNPPSYDQFVKLPFIQNPKGFDDMCVNDIYKFMINSKLFCRYTQPNYGILYFTRECIKRCLEGCSDSDIILLSDCDEIPNPEILRRLDEFYVDDEFYSFTQTCYCYYLNVLRKSHISNVLHNYFGAEPFTGIKTSNWKGTKMASYKLVKNYSLNEMRMQPSNDIQNGGWHFSFMGGRDQIEQKLLAGCIDRSYSEIPNLIANIENALKNLSDVADGENHLSKVEIDESYPEYIYNNLDKYKHLIL